MHLEEKGSQQIIDRKPNLQLIRAVHQLAEPVTLPSGETKHWYNLSKDVKPYQSGLELSNNIRSVVYDYVQLNIPSFREKTYSKFGDLDESQLTDAIVHCWGDTLTDEIGGQRREVLLSVASHVVRRIESKIYRDILQEATNDDLQKLGLISSQRDLTIQLLEIATRADPMFTRFLAFGNLTGKPPKNATEYAFIIPIDESDEKSSTPERPGTPDAYTISQLFPKEAGFLSRRFRTLSQTNADWQHEEGGELFKQYLLEIADYYQEKVPTALARRQKQLTLLSTQLLETKFPIIFTHSSGGYFKEPYHDPEIRISLITPDTKGEIGKFDTAKDVMADCLSGLGLQDYSESLRNKKNISAISIGPHGVNTIFNAVAQSDPELTMFLNEQDRQYDQDFWEYVKRFTNSAQVFGQHLQNNNKIKFMNRMNTMLHENSHWPFPVGSEELSRFGTGETGTIIDEIKADILYRALLPSIVSRNGVEGSREQWALVAAAGCLQNLKDNPENSEYFINAVYDLNKAFETGTIIAEGDDLTIVDYDKLFDVWRESAQELINLYRNPSTNERVAKKWLKTNCTPNEPLRRVIDSLKEEKE